MSNTTEETETIKVALIDKGETELAYYVLYMGKQVHIPKSQISKMDRVGKSADITIPFWLYDKHWD